MPAAAATFPTGEAKKKPVFGGKVDLKKGFFERAFNLKRVLKTTPLKKAIGLYEKIEDPVGELKKEIKIRIAERALFSMVGPSFRTHKLRNVANLLTNAPKEVFNWGYYGVWNGGWWYGNWGYKTKLQPKIDDKVLDTLLEGKNLDSAGRLVLKNENGEIVHKALQLDYKRSRFGVPESTTARLLDTGRGSGVARLAGKAIGHLKWGLINPALPLVSLLLSKDTLGYLGWEAPPGYFKDKFGRPLKDEQGQLVRELKVVTKDGREWTLHPSLSGPHDPLSKARVFAGRGAGLLNAVSGFSRYAYSARSFFSLKPGALGAFGWEVENLIGIRGGPSINIHRAARGKFAAFNRLLFYLHPRNLINGETFRLLGWSGTYAQFRGEGFDIKGWAGLRSAIRPRARVDDPRRWVRFGQRIARFIYGFHPRSLFHAEWRETSHYYNAYRFLRRRFGAALAQSPLGIAGGILKRWLLAAKKKSDDFWKNIVLGKILKFVFDLLVRLATWAGGKLASLGKFLWNNLAPSWLKDFLAKAGAKIGESFIGKFFANLGAKLAGNTALALGLRGLGFLGKFLLKGAFELFSWATAPELQILSYVWRGLSFLFSQTIGRLLAAVSSRLVASLASRLGIALAQVGWRALLGALLRTAGTWLASSAWPAVAGFFTTTLPAWAAAAAEALGAALAGLTVTSVLVAIGIAVTIAIILFVITIYAPALFWNPARSEVTHTPVILSKIVKVAPGDPAAGYVGTNRLPVDSLEHTVEYFFKVKNTADKLATEVRVTDQKLGKTFPTDGSAVTLDPGQEKEVGRFNVKVRANSQRVEMNEAIGTAVVEGETINFSDVGMLLVGNPPWAPPCGWPTTGILQVLFGGKYPQCPTEAECSGIQIVGRPEEALRPSQKVYSVLNGVVSQLWFDRKIGGVMKIKGLDGSFEIVYGFLTEASVKPVGGGLTKYGLKVGSQVTLGQEVAETYFGPLPLSWGTSLHYQVKVLHYGAEVGSFDNKDPLEFTPSRPARGATVPQEGDSKCW